MLRTIGFGLAVSAITAAWALPQGANARSEPDVPEKAGKTLRALRLRGEGPRIDGRLDDAVWAEAPSFEDFVQNDPANMEAPTERTVVRAAYDDRHLYVAVYCYMRDPAQVTAGLGRRDRLPPSDGVALLFDPRHDHLTGYGFETNPSGVQGDFTLFDDTSLSADYDGVWSVRTQTLGDGWAAEFQIPFSQMRFSMPRDGEMVWGFNVDRRVHRKGELDRWVANPRGARGEVSRFGHLVFPERFTPPRRLEVLPFVLGRSLNEVGFEAAQSFDGGLDIRYGLGTSATVSAVLNPDFGQVEQDPAVLNLTVFETQFTEKRPFFLEDRRVFVPPYPQFPDFYSPRIGRAPGRFALSESDQLVRKPDRTRILGAMKLTGKRAGWTYGGLTAWTAREHAVVETRVPDDGEGVRGRRLIEPSTSYNVARLQRDILGATSNVGLIGTAVVREKDLDAFTGGFDANLRWDRNRYLWNMHWVATHAPIAGVLRDGLGGATNFSFVSRHVEAGAHFDHFSRAFRNADLGFLTSRPNKNDANVNLTVVEPDPWSIFHASVRCV